MSVNTTPIGTATGTSVEKEDELLQRYLAERDAACPTCGYNLRAGGGARCPECGGNLALELRNPNPLRRRRALLLMIFVWLLLAGGMNSVRAGRDIYQSATRAQVIQVFSSLLAPSPPNINFPTMIASPDAPPATVPNTVTADPTTAGPIVIDEFELAIETQIATTDTPSASPIQIWTQPGPQGTRRGSASPAGACCSSSPAPAW